jgi:hypothetical protein
MRPPRKAFAWIVVAVCISTGVYAKKIQGYYIPYQTRKKVEVTFLIPVGFLSSRPSYESLQKEIEYIDGAQKYTLTPEEVLEVSFIFKGEDVVLRSVHNDLQDGYSEMSFLKVLVDGPVTLFNFYESHYTPGSMNPSTGMMTGGGQQTVVRLVLQRDGEALFKVRRLYFRKDLLEFFNDCPELVDIINSSSVADLEMIVKESNKKCK